MTFLTTRLMARAAGLVSRQLRRASYRSGGAPFVFSPENFRAPALPHGLEVVNVPVRDATQKSLDGYGLLISSPDEISCEQGNFEITPWPTTGWRALDPGTGDEAGTTEGPFEVWWQGDYFYGHNLAIATANNFYLDGLGCMPEDASLEGSGNGDGQTLFLWMSDYHPDGGQLFWPLEPIPFMVCLGHRSRGDGIHPTDMRAFRVPRGRGIYIHPGTWHNGVYAAPAHTPARFLTRQAKVHARVSASWAAEFQTLLRVPLGSLLEEQ
jgi:hypothetical protein